MLRLTVFADDWFFHTTFVDSKVRVERFPALDAKVKSFGDKKKSD